MEAPGVVRELSNEVQAPQPSLGTHTPSPPSHFVEILIAPLSPLSVSGACGVRPNCSWLTEL